MNYFNSSIHVITWKILLAISICLFSTSSTWGANSEWSEASVTDGITLYVRGSTGSRIAEVKAVMTVNGSLSGVTKLIMDADATPHWVFGVKKSEVLESYGENDVLVRNVIGLPWPLDDRDAINQMKVTQDAQSKQVTIDMINKPTSVAPAEGVIRMAVADGQWTLSLIADDTVEVTQVYKADPGGKVPEWVINMFLLEGPIATFKAMQKILNQPAYQNARLDFIQD